MTENSKTVSAVRQNVAPDRRREAWIAAGLTVVVAVVELSLLRLRTLAYFSLILQRTGLVSLVLHAGGVLLIFGAQGLFFWAALVASRWWRIGAFAVFTFVTILEFGYVKATGALTNAHDVDVALENIRLWSVMAGAFVDWRAALPVGTFLVALFLGRPAPGGHVRRFVGAAVVAVLVHSCYAASGYLHRSADVGMGGGATVPTGSLQAFARSLTMFVWDRAAGLFRYQLRDDVGYRARTMPARHVVLVIDESISAVHLSLDGYGRSTTPYLEELEAQGRLTNWGIASAATNFSDGSVLCLLTGVSELPDYARRTFTRPTLFQYAKAMNYTTHMFDGESDGRRIGLTWDDVRLVDDFRTAQAFGADPDSDVRIAHTVAELVKRQTGQFIVVFKRGNHFPHTMNYWPDRARWWPGPADRETAPPEGSALRDSYDNAIRYNLDAFFRALLQADGSLSRSVVVYTSDHGAVVDGETSNVLARRLSLDTAGVPLFMVGDDRPAVDTGYRASHHNIFATILDLLGVPAAYQIGPLHRSLLRAHATDRDERVVFNGFPFEFDGFERRDFDALVRPDPPRRIR